MMDERDLEDDITRQKVEAYHKANPVTSSRVCELCSPREYRAMRALESLTPNGSEFVNDPEACVAFVRDRMDSIIKVAKERNKANGAVMAVRSIVEEPYVNDDKAERFDELMERMEAIKEVLR